MDYFLSSDGSFAEIQVITDQNGGPTTRQTTVSFPPVTGPNSGNTPGSGGTSLQLPPNYVVDALDASGAVLARSNTGARLLFDQAGQTSVPADALFSSFSSFSYTDAYGYSERQWGGYSSMSRVTFGPYNEQSRLLIGGNYVKNNSGINRRRKLPFADAFTNSSYEYKATVTSVASNGVMMGSYSSKLISPSNSPLQYHHAISRDGKTIPLSSLVNPPISWSPGQPLPSPPRYSNVIGHTMNDSGMMVLSAEDAQNPTPPDANGINKDSCCLPCQWRTGPKC